VGMTPVLDARRLAELGDDLGDAEFLEETIGVYLSELPKRRAAMNAAHDVHDDDALRGVGHSLGSSSALFGAAEVEIACRALELYPPGLDMAGVAELVAQVNVACDRAQVAMQEWLAAQGSNR
jgi:HPt (histidine-containing phosphotransfer) domain-containing protein